MKRPFHHPPVVFGLLLLCFVAACPTAVLAHALGENYVFMNFREKSIDGRFEITFDDLEKKLGLDPAAQESADPLQAVQANAARVHEYIAEHFEIGPEGGPPYTLHFTTQEVLDLPQGKFAQFHFRADTGPLPDKLEVRHTMLYENDRFHRGLLLVEYNVKTDREYGAEYAAMLFSPATSTQTLDLTAIPTILWPRDMIQQGVMHIWIGIDHILFLIALVLPTVLVLGNRTWTPVSGFPRALWNLLKIVTAFTLAHSITLLLAAFGYLEVSSRFVESMIALSIVLVALNNITGKVRGGSLMVIVFLGLFHGLGFASVMGHLPFRMVDALKSVVFFNVGVELGQIAIVAVLFPTLFLLRKTRFYVPVILKGGSAVLILVAGFWFVQRAFGLG